MITLHAQGQERRSVFVQNSHMLEARMNFNITSQCNQLQKYVMSATEKQHAAQLVSKLHKGGGGGWWRGHKRVWDTNLEIFQWVCLCVLFPVFCRLQEHDWVHDASWESRCGVWTRTGLYKRHVRGRILDLLLFELSVVIRCQNSDRTSADKDCGHVIRIGNTETCGIGWICVGRKRKHTTWGDDVH